MYREVAARCTADPDQNHVNGLALVGPSIALSMAAARPINVFFNQSNQANAPYEHSLC